MANRQKIAIIGAGSVGATIAYTLLIKNLASEILLVDLDENKLDGEILDLQDGLPFSELENIKKVSFKEATFADIIILTAGLKQKPGETRLDLAEKNKKIITSIFEQFGELNPETILLVVSNPVDIITNLAIAISKLPEKQIIGTGTSLDTTRLRFAISKKLNIDSEQVQGFVLGEHGDTEFVAWSTVFVDGKNVRDLITREEMQNIEEEIKNKAYQIINKKGATYYGIAMTVSDIVQAIIFDQNKIFPVSNKMNLCTENIAIGFPAVIGSKGIVKNWDLNLTEEELEKMKISVETIKKYL